jgi:hypothetical protein
VGEHRQLAFDSGAAVRYVEHVAGVGVLGDQPQSVLFARSADQDRWVWATYRQRIVDRPRSRAGTTGSPDDHICLANRSVSSSRSNPLPPRRQEQTHRLGFLSLAAGADPEPHPASVP